MYICVARSLWFWCVQAAVHATYVTGCLNNEIKPKYIYLCLLSFVDSLISKLIEFENIKRVFRHNYFDAIEAWVFMAILSRTLYWIWFFILQINSPKDISHLIKFRFSLCTNALRRLFICIVRVKRNRIIISFLCRISGRIESTKMWIQVAQWQMCPPATIFHVFNVPFFSCMNPYMGQSLSPPFSGGWWWISDSRLADQIRQRQ